MFHCATSENECGFVPLGDGLGRLQHFAAVSASMLSSVSFASERRFSQVEENSLSCPNHAWRGATCK